MTTMQNERELGLNVKVSLKGVLLDEFVSRCEYY
jgi:hypothetical protein